jgi:hypothetical protein
MVVIRTNNLAAEQMAQYNLVFISERSTLPYTLVGTFQGNEKLYLVNLVNLVKL